MIGPIPGELPRVILEPEELARPIRFQRKPYDTDEQAQARDEAWEAFVESSE